MSQTKEFFKSRDFKVGAGSVAGTLAVVFMLSGGEPVPEEIVEVDLPKVDTYLSGELSTPEMQQLRLDMLRCGADFEISVNAEDGQYSVEYDAAVNSNERTCLTELEMARIEGAEPAADIVSPE